MISCSDAILAIAKEYSGRVPGRTLFQKIAYFISVDTESDFGYRPHYYGPYSPAVAATISEMVNIGELDEQKKVTGKTFVGHDESRAFYEYSLSDKGERAASIHESWDKVAFKNARQTVKKIKDLDVDYMQLAFASKVHYIIENVDGPITVSGVKEQANELNWPMAEEDVKKGAEILRKLGLIKR